MYFYYKGAPNPILILRPLHYILSTPSKLQPRMDKTALHNPWMTATETMLSEKGWAAWLISDAIIKRLLKFESRYIPRLVIVTEFSWCCCCYYYCFYDDDDYYYYYYCYYYYYYCYYYYYYSTTTTTPTATATATATTAATTTTTTTTLRLRLLLLVLAASKYMRHRNQTTAA